MADMLRQNSEESHYLTVELLDVNGGGFETRE